MKTRKIQLYAAIALVLVLGVALLVPQIVYAQQGSGTGTLTASGDGMATIRGNATSVISGNGILWIRDYAGDASIHVSGVGIKRVLPNGWIRYVGFHGEAQVTGSKVILMLSGYNIQLQATGTGQYLLRGEGTYSTGQDSSEWTGQILSLP